MGLVACGPGPEIKLLIWAGLSFEENYILNVQIKQVIMKNNVTYLLNVFSLFYIIFKLG